VKHLKVVQQGMNVVLCVVSVNGDTKKYRCVTIMLKQSKS